MSTNQPFDYEGTKKKALEQLRSGKSLFGKDGAFAPIETIVMAKTEGSYMKLLNQLEKVPLIILDDFGIHPINKNLKLALLQIMEDRYAKKSLIITAQMPVSAWHDYIDETTLADAIMDRQPNATESNWKETPGERKNSLPLMSNHIFENLQKLFLF